MTDGLLAADQTILGLSIDAVTALIVLVLTALGYWIGRSRAVAVAQEGGLRLHSLPSYYGTHVAWMVAVPCFGLMLLWFALEPAVLRGLVFGSLPATALADLEPTEREVLWADIVALATTGQSPRLTDLIRDGAATLNALRTASDWAMLLIVGGLGLLMLTVARGQVTPAFRARNVTESRVSWILILCSAIAILTTLGIVLSLVFESARFFARVPLIDFLTGTQWSPQEAIRAEQVGSSGAFGAVPVFLGTMLVTVIAISVAVPIGLLSAIYLSEYAGKRFRGIVKPVLEILAGVPTVVYGFFAFLTVGPFLRDFFEMFGLDVYSQMALSGGAVMGLMIVPFVSSLSDDVINAVPQSLRDGSYALGATKSETTRQVILPAALPGVMGAFLLAISRAVGETMIVVMALGTQAYLTFNPLDRTTTVTVQIVSLLKGDSEFDSAKTLSAFALGLVLFVVTLVLNIIALRIIQKYSERYD